MRSLATLSVLLFFAAGTCSTFAAIVTVPFGIGPGDPYRLVFVTDGTRDAISANILDYNAFVTAEATAVPELNALGTIWTTIASTPSIDARDNTGTNPFVDGIGVPIYGLNGIKIADSNNDLWSGDIDNPITRSPTDVTVSAQWVWTGSDAGGVGMGVSNTELGGSGTTVTVGRNNLTSGGWTNATSYVPFLTRRLYGISDVLQMAPIPEPSSLLLMVLGLASCFAPFSRFRDRAICQ